jgi:hypothetical protein
MMAIIDDFKALNDALGRLQGKVPRLYNEPTNANAQPPCLPCGQAPPGHQVRPGPPVPAKCSYCGGYGRINHPDGSSKTYPCPGCNGSEYDKAGVCMSEIVISAKYLPKMIKELQSVAYSKAVERDE